MTTLDLLLTLDGEAATLARRAVIEDSARFLRSVADELDRAADDTDWLVVSDALDAVGIGTSALIAARAALGGAAPSSAGLRR